MVRQEGSGLFKDVHLGHSPMEIDDNHLRGVLSRTCQCLSEEPLSRFGRWLEQRYPMCSREITTWVHDICGHGRCSNTEMG